jgi:cytoskeletal protein RodZ
MATKKASDETIIRKRSSHSVSTETLGLILAFLLTVGGWVWYASRLATQAQVKAIVVEQLKQYTPQTKYIQLKTRVDLAERQSAEWRKEVKQSLGEIKRTLKELAVRIHSKYQPHRYRSHSKQ